MRIVVLAAALGAAVSFGLPFSTCAQTQPPPQGQEAQDELRQRCNALTIIEGLSGDSKSQLMNDCMAGKVELPEVASWQQHYQSCADEGRFGQRLKGQELINYIETCVKQPASSSMSGSSTPPSSPSWAQRRQTCSNQGKFDKGLRGSDLIAYVDQCMGQ